MYHVHCNTLQYWSSLQGTAIDLTEDSQEQKMDTENPTAQDTGGDLAEKTREDTETEKTRTETERKRAEDEDKKNRREKAAAAAEKRK